MSVVAQTLPAPAPLQTKSFTKEAHLLPEPHRHLIASVAVDIYVERLPLQMGGSLRKGTPNPHESRLFRARTYRRCDLKRITGSTNHVDQPPRSFLDIRR